MSASDSDGWIEIQVVCPEEWKQFVPRFTLFIEDCYRFGLMNFKLQGPKQITLALAPSKSVDMEADWMVKRIDIRLPFRPSISVWLFSIYFGLAHEVGHLLWHLGPLTLREAWAHYFALDVLKAEHKKQFLPGRLNHILLRKDFWLSVSILRLMRYSKNPVEKAIANIVHVWGKAEHRQVSTFLHVIGETEEIEKSLLISKFSQHFDISEITCRNWLREE